MTKDLKLIIRNKCTELTHLFECQDFTQFIIITNSKKYTYVHSNLNQDKTNKILKEYKK